jgi:hypothetical protein
MRRSKDRVLADNTSSLQRRRIRDIITPGSCRSFRGRPSMSPIGGGRHARGSYRQSCSIAVRSSLVSIAGRDVTSIAKAARCIGHRSQRAASRDTRGAPRSVLDDARPDSPVHDSRSGQQAEDDRDCRRRLGDRRNRTGVAEVELDGQRVSVETAKVVVEAETVR